MTRVYMEPRRKMWSFRYSMGNSNNNAGNAARKTVPWIALLVALAALGIGIWLLIRKPSAAAAEAKAPGGGAAAKSAKSVSSLPGSPGSGAISIFDLREMSYFPRGLVDPMRESVNRVMRRMGDVTTRGYAKDKASLDRKLRVALDKFEKQAVGYTNIASLV